MTPEIAERLKDAATEYLAAAKASAKAADARAAMPLGSTRARLTTAASTWSRHAEDRDRKALALEALCAEVSR